MDSLFLSLSLIPFSQDHTRIPLPTTATRSTIRSPPINFTMQYYTLLSVLAGAAAVSAAGITGGLTDGLLGSSLTGTAGASADGDAKAGITGLPTDELLDGDLAGDVTGDAPGAKKASLIDGLGLKQLVRPPPYYPSHDPATKTIVYQDPTPTITVVATPTVTVVQPVDPPIVKDGPTPDPVIKDTNSTVNGVESCSEGTKTSCCDTKDASGGLLTNILGGSCALSQLNVPVLAVGGISGSQCNNGNTFCCPVNQDVS